MDLGELLRRYKNSEYAKNLVTLTTGTSISQLINILIAPILTRLFSPSDFGILAVFMSIVSALAVITSARYELAIMLPKRNKDAINLLALSFSFLICFFIFTSIVIVIINLFFSKNFSINSSLSKWLYFIPLVLFLIGSSQILNNWANRMKNYKFVAKYRIYNSSTTSSTNLITGFLGIKSIGLLIGTVLGNLVSVLLFLKDLSGSLNKHIKDINIKRMMFLANKYKVFPFTNSLQAISDMFQVNGIIYLVAYYFNSFVVGAYSFTIRILQAPMNLIGASIAQIFYQQTSEIYNKKGDISTMIKTTIIRSSLLGIPFFFIIFLFGPNLFGFIFGEEWRIAGDYARILSPYLLLDFIRAPISQVPLIINKQKQLFIFSIFSNCILVFSMIYGGINHNLEKGFELFSVLQSIYTIFIIYWIYKTSVSVKNI